MLILLLTNDFPSPWLPTKGTFNWELARALGRNHAVQVVAPIPWIEELTNARRVDRELKRTRCETRDGVQIHYPRYYYPPKIGRRWFHRFLRRSVRPTLHGKLRDFQPDAVIGYWTHPDGTVAVQYAREMGAAAFVMVGGSDVLVQARSSPQRQRIMASTLQGADGVFTVSQDLRRRVIDLGVPAERVHLAYRGVDRSRFSPGEKSVARKRLGIAGNVPLFVWVGRMVPVKGLDLLLDGARFQIALAGDGPERARLEARAGALGLGPTLRFVGSVPHSELPDWYRAADWTVLTSISEGVPNVLLESHACGTPFVATRVGGVPEIAIPGIDRLAVAGNADDLATHLAAALKTELVEPQELAHRVAGLDAAANEVATVLQRTIDLVPQSPAVLPVVRTGYRSVWRQAVRRGLAVALPRKMFLTGGPETGRQICLTFDDGPHPEHTPRLLDRLQQLHIKATFFVVGREALRHPDIVQRIADEGHRLGNHTWSHPDLRRLSPADFAEEVRRTSDLLAEFAGAPIRLFRPPLGKVTGRQMLKLWGLEQSIVLWNVDPKDYACLLANELRQKICNRTFQAGEIVLLHDIHPFAADILPDLAARVRAAGLDFTTVDTWTGTRTVRTASSVHGPVPELRQRQP
jgi:peptidoglycan/xylan/chitin deacetylase (PgdA/CDA1 family)/glycosyltransferase involved in cell wall biosynthesis